MSAVADYLSLPPFLSLVKFFCKYFSFYLLFSTAFLVSTFILYLVHFYCQVFFESFLNLFSQSSFFFDLNELKKI